MVKFCKIDGATNVTGIYVRYGPGGGAAYTTSLVVEATEFNMSSGGSGIKDVSGNNNQVDVYWSWFHGGAVTT